jgi:hypothetical protein
MKLARALFAAAAFAAIASAPAQADGGSKGKHDTPSSSSTSGGTSIPEPSDAILLLMGAAGVVIGRKLHARAKRKPED